ncbi:hypothetical protein BDB00DRAFT_811334 [Zychaea mexicana]|uniref:uncharacterized protein n=1 Tax=Zychaea mexicana TaxID=64656 RepID=UPI0022FEA87D|nr:uncharacterized protein BDB00DRAFT_811334 [Zychaea mexicana]KAI9495995.1 hypothetical protein BDB00DRAFT_811334 [Zychaea mexicana]
MPTLSLGYLATPVSLEAYVHASPYEIPPSTVLSIVGFGPTSSSSLPVNMLPAIARFILVVEPTATVAEKETFALLHESLNTSSYAIIPLPSRHVGILLPPPRHEQQQHQHGYEQQQPQYQFILQISQIPCSSQAAATVANGQMPTFDLEYLKQLPLQVMELCQNRQEEQLRMVARGIYKTAAVYGYWDLWLVLEGICTRFQINPQQLIQ